MIFPILNKATQAAFAGIEQKTLRDILAEIMGVENPTDEELYARMYMFMYSDEGAYSKNMLMNLYSFTEDEAQAVGAYLAYPAKTIINEYNDYVAAFQDANEFKHHVEAWSDKNLYLWAAKYTAIRNRVKFNDTTKEETTEQESLTRNTTNKQTISESTSNNGTNESTASLESSQTASELSSNFPIMDTKEGTTFVNENYIDGSKKTTNSGTSSATNNATASATGTKTGENNDTGKLEDTRVRAYSRQITGDKVPFELQEAYLKSLSNLTDEIVKSFATLLNGNMYAF